MTSSNRTTRLARRAFAPALVALGIFASSGHARAQRSAEDIASARQLYNEGIELRDKGDLKGALEKFRAAHALGNTPITGIDLCRTHSALGQPVEAREACLSVARIAVMAGESERSKGARSDAARLAEAERLKIASLRFKISGAPSGAIPTVVVDGVTVPAAALSASRAVNPGSHLVVGSVQQGPETRVTVEAREGETLDVELALVPGALAVAEQATEPASTRTPSAPKSKGNPLATASFIVAGAAGVVGVVAGLRAMSLEGDLDDRCRTKICGRTDWDDLDSARTAGTVSTVAFVGAGVALGIGLVAVIAGRSTKSPSSAYVAPMLGLTGGGIRGSF